MSTLQALTQRFALNQSSRVGLLEDLAQSKLVLWQGLPARLECALFVDTPSATTFVTDITNIDSVNLVVRKGGPNGNILFVEEQQNLTLNATYNAWIARTAAHFTFDISNIDTTQIVPGSGRLPIYFVITVTTTDAVPYIAGFGFGEIVDVGFIENPVTEDYVAGRTPIVGGKLLTNLDLNGFQIINSASPGLDQSGYVALVANAVTGTVTFQFPVTVPGNMRFEYLYVKDTTQPRQETYFVVIDTVITTTNFTYYLDNSPSNGNCILYWRLVSKILSAPLDAPAPRYVLPDHFNYTAPGTGAVLRTLTDLLSEIVDVKDFGVTGDSVTNDTTNINKAIAVANSLGQVIHFPDGIYSITKGGLTPFQWGIEAPEASFVSADTNEGALITVAPVAEGTNYRIRQLAAPVASQHGIGIHIMGANQCWFWINDIRWFGTGFFIDGEGSAAHTSLNFARIGKLAQCNDGIRFTSGPGGSDWNEANTVWVGYSHHHVNSHARFGNDGGSTTEIHDNIIHFGSMEVGHVSGSNGIVLGAIATKNTFIVDAGLGGAFGGGLDIKAAASSYNRFLLTYVNWNLITAGLNFWDWRNNDGRSGTWSPTHREFVGGNPTIQISSQPGDHGQAYTFGRDPGDGHLKINGQQTGAIGFDFNGPLSGTQDAFTPVTFNPTPAWANNGGGYRTAGYYKDPTTHRIYLAGVITGLGGPGTNGDAGTILFILPVGYRPLQHEVFGIANAGTANARIVIDTSGNVFLQNAQDRTTINLGVISFRYD